MTTKAVVGWVGVVVTGAPMKTPVVDVDVIAFDMLAAAAWAAAKEDVLRTAVTWTEPAAIDKVMLVALTPVVAESAAIKLADAAASKSCTDKSRLAVTVTLASSLEPGE